MKVREVIRILEDNGFRFVRQTGSHRRYEGVVNGRTYRVTVAGNQGDDISKRTLASIRRPVGCPPETVSFGLARSGNRRMRLQDETERCRVVTLWPLEEGQQG